MLYRIIYNISKRVADRVANWNTKKQLLISLKRKYVLKNCKGNYKKMFTFSFHSSPFRRSKCWGNKKKLKLQKQYMKIYFSINAPHCPISPK